MAFRFIVDRVFPLAEGGVVVEGRVESGAVREGHPIAFLSPAGRPMQDCILTIERSSDRSFVPRAIAGDQVRFLLPDASPSELAPGTLIEDIRD